MESTHLPIAVLISGGGTTLRNLLQRIAQGQLGAQVKVVISSTSTAGGLRFAAEAGVPAHVVRPRDYPNTEAFSEAVFGCCRDAEVALVVLGGFLKHVLVPPDFENRVMNIHPALLPLFCGKGFYGHHVHQAVLDFGAKVSGCTVHFVDNEYDHGPIIVQRTVPVLDDDTAESLAARVFEQECEAYPQAIQWFADGRLSVHGRRVRVNAPRTKE
jgi:phosphoribosylglycinamide formyltransferase 1